MNGFVVVAGRKEAEMRWESRDSRQKAAGTRRSPAEGKQGKSRYKNIGYKRMLAG